MKALLSAILMTALPLALYAGSDGSGSLYLNAGRGYSPFTHATSEGIMLSNTSGEPLLDSIRLAASHTSAILSFRIDNRHAHPGRRYPYTSADGKRHTAVNPPWGLFIEDDNGRKVWITVTSAEKGDITSTEPHTVLTISGGIVGSKPHEIITKQSALPFYGESLWQITLRSGHISIVGGGHEPHLLGDVATELSGISVFGFVSSPAGEILASDISLFSEPSTSDISTTEWSDEELLSDYLAASESEIEGYWEIYDRSLEESLLQLGGEYKTAIVKHHDRYAVIYLSGAKVNSHNWHRGMVKGWLVPGSFPGIYRLEWYDAEGRPLSKSITAQLTEAGILTIRFPYQSSTLRLRRVE